MKNIYLLTALIVFLSCNNKIDLNHLQGKWIETKSSEKSNPETIKEISFSANGTYQFREYNLKDSLKTSFVGTFDLEHNMNTIHFTNTGLKLKDMSLKKLTKSEMTVEIFEFNKEIMVVNYKKE